MDVAENTSNQTEPDDLSWIPVNAQCSTEGKMLPSKKSKLIQCSVVDCLVSQEKLSSIKLGIADYYSFKIFNRFCQTQFLD